MKFRPLINGDIWDQMTPAERRVAWLTDLLIGCGGSALILLAAWWLL